MRHLVALGSVLLVPTLALVGCSSSTEPTAAAPADADAGPGPVTPSTCTRDGEAVCDGDGLRTCRKVGERLELGAAVACEGETSCRDGACREPSASQLAHAKGLEDFVGGIRSRTAWHGSLDYEAILREGRLAIVKGADDDLVYLGALRKAFLAIPQGHQGLYLKSGCGKTIPYESTSRFGVCGRPFGDTVVVTAARDGNLLGLKKGDRVVEVDGTSGAKLLEDAALRPMCSASAPSASYRRTSAAASFFGTVPSGAKLVVESPSGERRTVVVPAERDQADTSCFDPLGRDTRFVAKSETLADGTAVVRVPSFVPFDVPFPTSGNQADYDAYRAAFQARIVAEFDKVKSAPRLVWDVRSNGGGLTLVGLAIASGMPGARAGNLTSCVARIAKSEPPRFDTTRYAEYALSPGGEFAYSGRVAVLVDGLDYSAADYFPYAVRAATSGVLVGTPTAGAYGGTSGSFEVTAPPVVTVSYDVNKCEAADGTPLEGKGVEPHVVVEYDPASLAAGRDAVLERAVAELKK